MVRANKHTGMIPCDFTTALIMNIHEVTFNDMPREADARRVQAFRTSQLIIHMVNSHHL